MRRRHNNETPRKIICSVATWECSAAEGVVCTVITCVVFSGWLLKLFISFAVFCVNCSLLRLNPSPSPIDSILRTLAKSFVTVLHSGLNMYVAPKRKKQGLWKSTTNPNPSFKSWTGCGRWLDESVTKGNRLFFPQPRLNITKILHPLFFSWCIMK